MVTRWCKSKGDAVSAGEIILEIETDKTTFEVTAPASGTLLEVFFGEGTAVPVFTNLCVIGDPGEDVEGYRPAAALVHAAAPATAATATDGPGPVAVDAAAFSPRASRFAKEHDFYPAVAGSGPGGRVLEADLRRAYAQPPAAGVRERIARRMRESLATTAQYTLHATARAGGLLAARAKLKASATPEITINDLVAFCTLKALPEASGVNSEYVGGKIRPHAEVHLGFACDTPRGLLVPVIRDAHTLSLMDLAVRTKDLAALAVEGKIPPDLLLGATFTISNLGNLGIEAFTPLLNPPQVAILGVGAIQVRPVRKEQAVEFIDVIGLSLTCDHQVIDGAPGARFLRLVTEKIESVESLIF